MMLLIQTLKKNFQQSNGTLCGRINVRGFKQVEGQHNKASNISAPVSNGMTIKLVLTLMLAIGGIAHVVDVNSLSAMDGHDCPLKN
jgi:hypothetical protein